jgi:hypothetical protein
MTNPRVMLMEVEIRTSERTGRPWYSARLGRARVIGFEAEEPNERGHRVIRLFVEEPSRDGPPRSPAKPPGRDSGSGREIEPRSTDARPEGSQRPLRRESATARRERVAGEVATAYGLGEGDPDDALPF